jgi:hypothetical protein
MCASVAARVLDYTKAQEQVLIGLLERLVEAESPSANTEVHDEVRRILRLALADVGYESRETGGPNRHRICLPVHPGARRVRRRNCCWDTWIPSGQ